MSQKKISQYYVFSVVWIVLGLALAVGEDGFMRVLYIVSTIVCLSCAVDFYRASQRKYLLSKITLGTAALLGTSTAVYSLVQL
jgi:hypothetical protein